MNTEWEYVGVLVSEWQVLDWTSLSAFQQGGVVQGMHFMDALNNIGKTGWEMVAAHPESNAIRYWFKRKM